MTLLEHLGAWWDEQFVEVHEMATPKIEVFPHGDGQFGFHLVGGNGEIQAGGEGYTRKSDAMRGAAAAKRNWACALIEFTPEPRKRRK